MADGVEGRKLPRAVVAVATCRIDIRRLQQAHLLVVPQRANAQVKQARDLANAEQALGILSVRVSHRTAPFDRG